jgi:hypothetical protein
MLCAAGSSSSSRSIVQAVNHIRNRFERLEPIERLEHTPVEGVHFVVRTCFLQCSIDLVHRWLGVNAPAAAGPRGFGCGARRVYFLPDPTENRRRTGKYHPCRSFPVSYPRAATSSTGSMSPARIRETTQAFSRRIVDTQPAGDRQGSRKATDDVPDRESVWPARRKKQRLR